MANRASIAARAQLANERITAAMQAISEKEGIDIPPASTFPIRQPELRAVFEIERVAGFLEQLAGITPVQDESTGDETESTPAESPEATNAPEPQPEAEEDTEEEPVFHGKPLSFYADLTDEQILDIKGIGPATLAEIRAAQAK